MEGWDVVGFDIERHQYGEHKYPAQLVLQDILTIDGRQFRGRVSLIVASPPCQKYSYMAMPWTRAKDLERWYRDEAYPERIVELRALFDACFRIAREAECPIVVENVRGAQTWVGRARATFGSFYLWGDVPALMPITRKHVKVATMGAGWYPPEHPKHVTGLAFNGHADRNLREEIKNTGGSWFAVANNTSSGHSKNPVHEGTKNRDADGYERNHPAAFGWKTPRTTSKGKARKAASAHIAKIPLVLARHIARVYHPDNS